MKVAIVGEMFSRNVGDAFIYESLRGCLASHGIDVLPVGLLTAPTDSRLEAAEAGSVGQSPVGWTGELKSHLASMPRMRRTKNHLEHALHGHALRATLIAAFEAVDAVLIGGGQLITDQDFGLPPRIDVVGKAARTLNVPTAFLGVGAGESCKWTSTRIYTRALEESAYVSVRGARSQRTLSSMASRPIEVHADLALLSQRAWRGRDERVVGINIMAPRYLVGALRPQPSNAIIAGFVGLCRGALSHGHEVRLLTNGDNDDYLAAQEVQAELAADGVACDLTPPPLSPIKLEAALDELDILIATRMHAGIVAWSMGVTTVPLAWDSKVREVWANISRSAPVPLTALLEKEPFPAVTRGLRRSDCDEVRAAREDASLSVVRALGAVL